MGQFAACAYGVVVFYGNDFKIEIWAKEEFEKERIPNDEYIAIAESLSDK